jgi:hypothetical protein
MQRVIYHTLTITLEAIPSGLTSASQDEAIEETIAAELLSSIGESVRGMSLPVSLPASACEVYVRVLPIEDGARVQVLLCWVALDAPRQHRCTHRHSSCTQF